jgi:hypothetical protein
MPRDQHPSAETDSRQLAVLDSSGTVRRSTPKTEAAFVVYQYLRTPVIYNWGI